MAYTQPRLNTSPVITLAHPSEYTERVIYLGARAQLANGTYRTQLVNNTLKRAFYIRWNKLTGAEYNTLRTAFDTVLKNSTSFTSPDGSTFTVVLDPSQTELEAEAYRIGNDNTFHWRAVLRLREV